MARPFVFVRSPYEGMGKRFLDWSLKTFGSKAEAARNFGKTQSSLDRYWKGYFPISYELERKMLEAGASTEEIAFIKFGKSKPREQTRRRYYPPPTFTSMEVQKVEELLNFIEKHRKEINLDTLLSLAKALLKK